MSMERDLENNDLRQKPPTLLYYFTGKFGFLPPSRFRDCQVPPGRGVKHWALGHPNWQNLIKHRRKEKLRKTILKKEQSNRLLPCPLSPLCLHSVRHLSSPTDIRDSFVEDLSIRDPRKG